MQSPQFFLLTFSEQFVIVFSTMQMNPHKEANMRTFDESTMIRINDVKSIAKNLNLGNRRFFLRDTSGGSSSGYAYDLVEQVKVLEDYCDENGNIVVSDWVWQDVRKIASSHDTHLPQVRNKIGGIGAYGPTFDRAEIAEVLA